MIRSLAFGVYIGVPLFRETAKWPGQAAFHRAVR